MNRGSGDDSGRKGAWAMGTLATLITIELSAIAALHRLGRVPGLAVDWRHLSTSLIASSTEDVLAGTLRLVALACAYWLLLSTTLYITARLAHLPAAVRALEWATLPAVRRLADRALAVAVVSSTLTGGAGVAWAGAAAPFEAPLVVLGVKEPTLPSEVQPPPPPTLEVPCLQPLRDDNGLVLPPPTTPQPDVAPPRVLVPPPTAHGLLIPPNPRTSPDPPPGSADGQHDMPTEATNTLPKSSPTKDEEFHEVVRGDNLWHIAASTLRRRPGHGEVTDARIAAYWRVVIDANRHRLRSGNPNLIFAGERMVLPRVSEEWTGEPHVR